jgi:D-amino-acid oxidase
MRELTSLSEALEHADIVIDCAGLGARELVPDPSMFPIRGQLMHVANPGIEHVFLDEHHAEGIAYVVPRGDDCVLGGTVDEDDEDLVGRSDDASRILQACGAMEPALLRAPRLADVVGLRPGRATVRLEAERPGEALVVHDYGHGGAGVTLSWGCALEVVDLVQQFANERASRS